MRDREELHVPYIYIRALCTHPDWQHHGAASILMDWAIKGYICYSDIKNI